VSFTFKITVCHSAAAFVLRGHGVGLIETPYCEQALARGDLVRRLPRWTSADMPAFLHCNTGTESTADEMNQPRRRDSPIGAQYDLGIVLQQHVRAGEPMEFPPDSVESHNRP
jgi:hypothetical protein